MAIYMLWAAAALIFAVALYYLYIQIHQLLKVRAARRAFCQAHPDAHTLNTSQGMAYFCLFMLVFGLIMAFMEPEWPNKAVFGAISLLFAGFFLKNYTNGQLTWSRHDFVWKEETRSFASIRNFESVSRQTMEILFTKSSSLFVPVSTGRKIQDLKACRPAQR